MRVIGIAGFARSGKDTFVGIASDILRANAYRPMRVAFADLLKDEVECMVKDNHFKASVRTDDTALKNMIRPLMVWWGCQRRYESEGGLYWVNEVDAQLDEICLDYLKNGESHENVVILVSDVRFPNEAKWIHEKRNGKVIHLKRYTINSIADGGVNEPERILKSWKVYDPAPNEEEAKQDPLVEAQADIHAEWENQKHNTTLAAVQNDNLKQTVLTALEQTGYFKLNRQIIGKLTL